MKIFITGATGFVGAHTALALLAAGHSVRLLVRNEARARQFFAAHGHALDDFVVADMGDAEAIKRQLKGCDAVVHAAARVELDPRQAEAVYKANVQSIDAVLGSAVSEGIDTILWVSSLSVFLDGKASAVDEYSPLVTCRTAYTRSKRDCEILVRQMQADGAPIQITYPGCVVGPDDPNMSVSNGALQHYVKTVLCTSTGIQLLDVRDLAEAHKRLLEAPHSGDPCAARYVISGLYLPWSELHQLLQSLTGLQIPHPKIPGFVLRQMGRLVDLARKLLPMQTDLSEEAMLFITRWGVADSVRFFEKTKLRFRPTADTLRDALRWQVEAGLLKPHRIGKLQR